MSKVKRHIKTYFKEKKINVFTTFLVLALLFSVLTKLSSDYTKTIAFSINPINIPEGNVIVADSSQTIDVTFTTYGFKWIKYYFRKPLVTVDFSNLEKTKTHFFWTEKKGLSEIISQFDAKEIIGNITPDTLVFKYGKNTVKMIPVVLHKEVDFLSGFDLVDDLKVFPDSIKIIGPQSVVDTIYSVNTELLLLEEINKNIEDVVNLKLPELNDNVLFSNTRVTVKGLVEKYTEGKVEVPVIVKNVPESVKIKYYPKTIAVVFSTSLNNYKSISSNSFTIECDFRDLQSQSNYLIPKIVQQTDKVKNVKLNVKRVEFILIK